MSKYTKKEAIQTIKQQGWTQFTKLPIGRFFRVYKKEVYSKLKQQFTTRKQISKELIISEAKKYNKRSDFQKQSGSIYNKAKRLGILDKVCSHMIVYDRKGEQNPRFKWTKEKIIKEANKYKTKSEFETNSPRAVQVAKQLGIYEEITSHMTVLWRPLTKQEVIDEAKKYKTRSAFIKAKPGYYQKAKRLGILDQICSHMISTKELLKKPNKWTKENIKSEALKYKTIKDFRTNATSAYNRAKKTNILKEVTSHMIHKYNWTKETALKESKKYNYKSHFKSHSNSAYNFLERNNLLSEIKHFKNTPFTKDELIKIAKNYNKRNDFYKGNSKAYNQAKREGILKEITKHFLSSKEANSQASTYWTKKRIIEIAKKYNDFKKFREENTGAYLRAKKTNILKKVTSHMRKVFRWNKELLKNEALKHNTKTLFQKNASGAYDYALRLKKEDPAFFESLFTHMSDDISQREFIAQKKFYIKLKQVLNKHNLKHIIKKEYNLGKRDTKQNNRVDFFIELIDYNISFNIEMKHDDSWWSKQSISKQRSRYNRCSRKKNHIDTYIVSPNGKYGFSEKEFIYILNHLIQKEEILLYNSLSWVRKELQVRFSK